MTKLQPMQCVIIVIVFNVAFEVFQRDTMVKGYLQVFIFWSAGFYMGHAYMYICIYNPTRNRVKLRIQNASSYWCRSCFKDAGLVLTVKTHGLVTGPGPISKNFFHKIKIQKLSSGSVSKRLERQHNHHDMLNHTAILLIRDPYKAIIGR